jgi:hypothetical protein
MNRHYQDADTTYNGFVGAAPALNMSVEEAERIELDREDDIDYFDGMLDAHIKHRGEP